MTWGTITVRNACPFPVTFYALAGPTIELGAGETKSAKACLIWFSTRVKGGGTVINQGWFQEHAQEYWDELSQDNDIDPSDTDGGGSGAAAGSILGTLFGYLDPTTIFMVKNTDLNDDGINMYFGAKKEGVYGNSNLVVYPTLDPACQLPNQNPQRYWYYLHLEKDTGQQYDPDPPYVAPDLSQYRDGMFFRLRNVANGQLLYNTGTGVVTGSFDSSFGPLENPEYWAMSPIGNDADLSNIKILHTQNSSNGWFTAYANESNVFGVYPLGFADYIDQHWSIQEIQQNPEIIRLINSNSPGYCLVASESGQLFMYPTIEGSKDQQWRPESFLVDVADIPDGTTIRIMHAMDGKYITAPEAGGEYANCGLVSYIDQGNILGYFETQRFVLKKVGDRYAITTSDGKWNLSPRDQDAEGHYTLSLFSTNDGLNGDWTFRTTGKKDGFIMQAPGIAEFSGGATQLFWRSDSGFAFYIGDYDDQIWVAQLD
jgi:hypothetical protein